MAASQKSAEPSSPSASSIFLPLGRRGSRASLSTQVERLNLNEALDQIHSAAYQSDSLTVFNEFTNPPSSSAAAAENTNTTSDPHGGLSGLYSRFRASVGGVKDMVGSSARPSEGASFETSPANNAGTNTSSAGALDPQLSYPNSAQASVGSSPAVGTLSPVADNSAVSPSSRGTRPATKPTNGSSKVSASSTPTMNSPVPGLLKTTGPAVTETNVNAVRDGLIGANNSPSTVATNTLSGGDQPNPERREGSLRSSLSDSSGDAHSQRSYSPVLNGKSYNNPYREAQELPEPVQGLRSGNDKRGQEKIKKVAPGIVDRRELPELDTSFTTSRKPSRIAGNSQDTQVLPDGNITTASSSSLTVDGSTAPTSATNSLTKVPIDDSSSQDGRASTTLATSIPLSDNEISSANSSKPSLNAPRDTLTTRVSQSRLPGYVMSRASSSDTATDRSTIVDQSANQAYRNRPLIKGVDSQYINYAQLRSKLLSKEFWMRDENAKDCFLCGEPFTTFRRKHHCRTCGQIFDSKCTVLIPGSAFAQTGSIRVCKACEDMINSREYDSSDFSDVEQSPVVINHRFPDFLSSTSVNRPIPDDDDDTSSVMSQPMEHVIKTPTMAIPATRRIAESGNRRSAVLEIDSDRPLARPTSSRSLRSAAGLRNHSISHKRHHSRQQHLRGFKSYHEDRAPFQRRHLEETDQGYRLPAFHRDNIIDPDLAQYLSDDASSGDEQPSLLSIVSDGSLPKNNVETERATFGGLLAAVKKSRTRFGDRNVGNGPASTRDGDDGSISSSRAVNLSRPGRRRNLSVASSVHPRLSPRSSKEPPLQLHDHHHHQSTINSTIPRAGSGFTMTRSSSMRGAGAPAIELNRASLDHVRKLLGQLLKDASIPHFNNWETALLPILLKATDEVDPAVQGGDDMDIRHYVKLKKIPGGRPGDTSYVSGLVFTKNLALKSMPRSIPHPNILIITFALEYARHQQQFMSLEPVIRQEREFLENLVSRIAALRPNLLLVEKSVSGLALELLEKANIATAYNVKPSVLEAVSRCTHTRIMTSMDKLVTTPAHTGHCGSFDLKTYVNNSRRKTYMYISGCPKELGCTIVLRGADNGVLARVKRITEFMVYVVYNLKLETCLMRDEFAKIPTSDDMTKKCPPSGEKSGAIKLMASNESATDQNNDIRSKSTEKTQDGSSDLAVTADETEVPDDVPMPTFYEDMVEKHETKILSASPCVKFEPPYLLMRARELERRLAYLKRLRDQHSLEDITDDKNKPQKFVLITSEMVHQSPAGASEKVREVLHAVHDAEYDRALHNYLTQKRQWEAYLSGNSNLFDPFAHQNIVVLYSLVCTATSVPCSGPDIFALDFYNEHESDNRVFETDCTLGQYVEDLCLEANTVCTANGCEKRMFEHHRQYVHGEAQISIFVQPYPCKVRGLQDTILMWSCCKICGNETQVIPMSSSTWKYSFGKYLELSFWSRDIRVRAGVCPHDIHRDHLRFFGFKDVALRIHYDPITLLEINVPRTRVTWKVDNDLQLRNEIYKKSEHRITKFMASVKARLKSINVESVMPEMVEECREETEVLVKKANEDHISLIRQLQDKYMNSRYWEMLPLNEVLRSVQEKVVEWDTAFAEFEKNYFPSEKDIRRLATLQLKKIFLDKDASVTSLTPADEPPTTPTETETDGHEVTERSKLRRRMTLSPEKAQDVLVSVVEEHSGRNLPGEAEGTYDDTGTATSDTELRRLSTLPQAIAVTQEEVQHLDLAMPSSLSDETVVPPETPGDVTSASRSITPSMDTSDRRSNSPSPEFLSENSEGAQKIDMSLRRDGTPTPNTPSGIPRLAEKSVRRSGKALSPPLFRAYSQPVQMPRERNNGTGPMAALKSGFGNMKGKTSSPLPSPPAYDTKTKLGDKKLSDRLGLTALKSGKLGSSHSLIPRSIPTKRRNPRVSSLARHFEQLSREFEKERQRERLQRAAKSKHSRAYPMSSSKATVEVYKNVREAVEEREPSGEGDDFIAGRVPSPVDTSTRGSEELSRTDTNVSKEIVPEQTKEPLAESKTNFQDEAGEIALEEGPSDEDRSLTLFESAESVKLSPDDDLDLKELPKHERSTLVKMLTNFWAERSASGWQPLDYPLKVSDHVFADCDIIIREDEPSSLVAFALDSHDYKTKLASIEDHYDKKEQPSSEGDMAARNETRVEHALLRPTGTHLKYQFEEGQAKMLCKVFYAEQFDALRRKCGVADRIVESLSRCAKWDSKGGKTNSLFLKTLDDRFVLKSLSQIETQAFLKFAPAYFQIMSEALFHELPSAIAKMFGFYQVIIKNPVTGVEFNWFLLVTENLFYDRAPTRIFDLKGSMRNRKVESTGERDEVLLDENMVDFIYETPLFTREHSKKLLSQSVWNDTLFLGRQNVMDYSLMIAIDEPRKELVVGIIDCIRTYTWDKKLESWIKDRGFAGGGKNRPTVTSPKEYKSRFREAMARYVLHAPK